MSSLNSFTKPLLKWVGGKTQIINKVLENFPKKIDNYHEPFVGGGSVLIALLESVANKEIELSGIVYAYDLNSHLIDFYKSVKNHSRELYDNIASLWEEYDSIETFNGNKKPVSKDDNISSKESFYYWQRNRFNSRKLSCVEKSAVFVFLNKHCFRGVYRENSKGVFNVPFGNYKKPKIISYENILYISNLVKDVVFLHKDFRYITSVVKDDDFLYLDPPYAPENELSFTKYNSKDFLKEDHEFLFNFLQHTESLFVMSNSNTDFVKKHFSEEDFKLDIFSCKRSINSKKPGSKTMETLISNFW